MDARKDITDIPYEEFYKLNPCNTNKIADHQQFNLKKIIDQVKIQRHYLGRIR